jgi:hypothetical protein
MSGNRTAKITRFIHEDDFDLRLGIGELIELSEVRDCGPPAILTRLQEGAWFVQDITETVRLALIGGGMSPKDAKALVGRAIKEAYLIDYQAVALEALYAAMIGMPEDMPEATDDEPGEPETSETESTT